MRHTSRVIHDPDEFGDAVSGLSLTVEFQRRQVRPSRVEQFQTPAWGLDFGEAHAKTCVHGILPGGWASLCLVRGPGDATWNGQPASTGTLCCVPPGEELDGRTAPGFSWMTVALPPAAWAQCRSVAGLDDHEFHRYAAAALTPARLVRFERQISVTHRRLRGAATLEAAAFSAREANGLAMDLAILACELAGQKETPRDSLRNRTRLARRGESWMRENLGGDVRMPDLCAALRVSRRELEYSFRTTYDQSPRDYLHTLRLHAVRRTLLAREEPRSILEIAFAHGISHPGRFAADYRSLFGERPSETQKR
ncbi:MAG: helix-turn-helix domain-containing protein [Chthoniobacter sp.]